MIFSYASGQTFTVGNGRYSLSTLERRFENILATERYNRRLEPYHRLDIGFTKQKTFLDTKEVGMYKFIIFTITEMFGSKITIQVKIL